MRQIFIKTMRQMFFLIGITTFFSSACNKQNNSADAYGNFMADEVIVAAETSGQIKQAFATEGQLVKKGDRALNLDTVQGYLKVTELKAKEKAAIAKLDNISTQIAVYTQQKEVLNKDLSRINKMLSDGAATQKQYDDITGQIQVIDRQIAVVQSNYAAVQAEIQAIRAGVSLSEDMLSKTKISFPVTGTVLEKYVEAGELAVPGKALFKVANLDTMKLTAYVSGKQLTSLKLRQKVTVGIDDKDGGIKKYEGTISWIASQAEFTPKNIQTREERLSQVYAIKIAVKNDGAIRINMPGEVWF
jgi:HlyD family secretion protein